MINPFETRRHQKIQKLELEAMGANTNVGGRTGTMSGKKSNNEDEICVEEREQ